MIATKLTGKWKTRCTVCGLEYDQGCGSTPCCGALQEVISHEPDREPCDCGGGDDCELCHGEGLVK